MKQRCAYLKVTASRYKHKDLYLCIERLDLINAIVSLNSII